MNEKIIENFLSLCAIPHKSHHEEKISRFLYDWAVKKGLAAVRDEEGNVIIDKPGSAGHEDAPRTILQAHMDMVVVWEDGMTFDPLNDTITIINDGKTLKAKGTSLGGDDGAGVALAEIRRRIGMVSPELQAYTGLGAEELLEAALRRKPDLLLLDEFCLNLDAPAAARVRTRVDAWLRAHPACAAICVAHRPGDVPPGFTRECVLGLGGRG